MSSGLPFGAKKSFVLQEEGIFFFPDLRKAFFPSIFWEAECKTYSFGRVFFFSPLLVK